MVNRLLMGMVVAVCSAACDLPTSPSSVSVTTNSSLVNQPGPVPAGGDRANHPPDVGIDAAPRRVAPGEPVTLTVSATDADGDPVTYAWEAPAGVISCTACRITTWTAPDDAGSYTVSVTVRDGRGGATTRSVSILVTS